MAGERTVNLRLSDYKKEGLYLLFPDSTRLDLTKENIERTTEEFWKDPSKITPEVKRAIAFQKCPFCPRKGKKDICDALRPIVPFLEHIDKYVSFNKVLAVYKEKDGEILHVADTTMQTALRYVSILGLLFYHQMGIRYWKYYYGIIPLEDSKEAAIKIYLNMYWYHKGNRGEIDKIIAKFNEELRITSQNQVKRLGLICKNDAFVNAIVTTHIATEFLTMGADKILEKAFASFEEERERVVPL